MTTAAQLDPQSPPVDKSSDRVRRMFAEISGRYDFLNHLLSCGVDRYWRWRTVRELAPGADARMLDVCSGTGDLALALLKAGGTSSQVTASDFCREMLQLAAAKARRRHAANRLRVVEADTMRLPFAGEQFDIVTVAFGLRNCSDTDKALREMTRVCTHGGKVAVLEFSMPRWRPLRAVYGWYFRRVLPCIGRWLAANRHRAYDYLPQSVSQFPQGEALARRMRDAGLRDVAIQPMTLGVATLYLGTK